MISLVVPRVCGITAAYEIKGVREFHLENPCGRTDIMAERPIVVECGLLMT